VPARTELECWAIRGTRRVRRCLPSVAFERLPLAASFVGDVQVDGDIFLPGADCAEHFDVVADESVEPGAVMVIDGNGALRQSREAYDTKVAGVVSGAGTYRPGLVLDKQSESARRLP